MTSAGHNWARRAKDSTAPRRRLSAATLRRITWRMLAGWAIVLFMVGFPIYTYVASAITGGISRRGDMTVVDLKAMSDFEMDQIRGTNDDVPARYRNLDGKRVMLAGEIWAPQSASGRIGRFHLVYSINKCCFSGPPKVQHFVRCKVKDDGTVDYCRGLVNVTGTLHVAVEAADGRVQSVYRLEEVERVDP
jgi:hypothetical protein